jgi:hypothetical protein
MRVFNHPNLTGFKCPICGKADDRPVVLVAIYGTQEANISEARQYHIDCIELTEVDVIDGRMILQKYKEPTA